MRVHPHSSAAQCRLVSIAQWQRQPGLEGHRVPFGALVLDAKYCELCGGNFLRRKQSKDKYCSQCLLRLHILDQEEDKKLLSRLIH